jgi:transcriptional regulator with XRE-family HTH domain
MTKQVPQILAERVKTRLAQLDKTQEWLGEASGGTGAGVRKALGEGRAVRVDTLVAWAKALDVSADWLLGVADKKDEASEEQLRLLCIKAIVSAPLKDLLTFRAGFAHLFIEAPADKNKSRSSL